MSSSHGACVMYCIPSCTSSAERCVWNLHAVAEEAQPALDEDRDRQRVARLHGDGARDVRQQVVGRRCEARARR